MSTLKTRKTTTFLTVDISSAIDHYLESGGTIDVISHDSKTPVPVSHTEPDALEYEIEQAKKTELLRSLVSKGAGMSALQYSLRMSKRDIRRIAVENGLKISRTRPIYTPTQQASAPRVVIDDAIAGHAMHYAALGYSALEAAQVLELSLRQIHQLAMDYRFEFKSEREELN